MAKAAPKPKPKPKPVPAPKPSRPRGASDGRYCTIARARWSEMQAPRQSLMRELREQGLTYKQIAERIGGTPDGVRGSLRKMKAK